MDLYNYYFYNFLHIPNYTLTQIISIAFKKIMIYLVLIFVNGFVIFLIAPYN